MTTLTRTGGRAVTDSSENVNVDGKGANGFLLDWYRSMPVGVVAKPERQILAEYFSSMLVLSAGFGYRPAVGTQNYLYYIDDEWSLSLISPDEWSEERRAGFVGQCELQADMTWTVTPSARLADKPELTAAVGAFFDAFADTLDSDMTFEQVLPDFVAQLPYYPRLFANAMSRSVRLSARLADVADQPCRQWRRELPRRLFLSATQTAPYSSGER